MINLQKGQRIEIGLSKVGVGLGWDPNESTGYAFDLDASAFMLGGNKKLPKDEFFVFFLAFVLLDTYYAIVVRFADGEGDVCRAVRNAPFTAYITV